MTDFNNIKVEPHFNINLGKDHSGRVGILNEGKGNKFINNTFRNLSVGIHDKGEDTVAEGNQFS